MSEAAHLLHKLGSYEEARIDIDRAVRLSPFVRWEDLAFLSECLNRPTDRQLAEAIQSMLPAIQARDRHASAQADELRSAV